MWMGTLVYFFAIRTHLQKPSNYYSAIRMLWLGALLTSALFLLLGESNPVATNEGVQTWRGLNFINVNYTAFVLALGLVSALWILLLSGAAVSKKARWVVFLSLAPLAASLWMTHSRASIIGAMAATLILLIPKFARLSLGAVILAWLALLLSTLTGAFTRTSIMDSLANLPIFSQFRKVAQTDDILSGRAEIWGSYSDAVREQPILGYGFKAYPEATGIWAPAHNWYLDTWASVGLVGLALLVGVLALCLVFSGNFASTQSAAVTAALAVVVLSSAAVSTTGWDTMTWAVLAILSGAGGLAVRATHESTKPDLSVRGRSPRGVPLRGAVGPSRQTLGNHGE